MKTMPAAKFKARCLRVMDEVRSTREAVLITKKGKAVAKLVPAETGSDDVFGCMKGQFKIAGDILAPVVPPEDWDALK